MLFPPKSVADHQAGFFYLFCLLYCRKFVRWNPDRIQIFLPQNTVISSYLSWKITIIVPNFGWLRFPTFNDLWTFGLLHLQLQTSPFKPGIDFKKAPQPREVLLRNATGTDLQNLMQFLLEIPRDGPAAEIQYWKSIGNLKRWRLIVTW